jgi:uncharacterized protein YkwD
MRRHFTYKYTLILGVLFLSVGIYAFSSNLKHQDIDETLNSPNITEIPVSTLAPTQTPTEANETFHIRGTSINLGESEESVISKLGAPSRISDTEFDFDYYIYNNDYKRLLFIAIKEKIVVGFYSDSLDFSFNGIQSGATLTMVHNAFGNDFPFSEVLTHTTDSYTVNILMDQLDTQKVTGIYVLLNTVALDEYTESVMRNIELIIFDLTNSVRARNKEAVLSWSSSAAIAARKHSIDMSENDFFNHMNPAGWKPGERMTAEGIYYQSFGENIIAGYDNAILSHHGWFNSANQRKYLLASKFRYLGVGFNYNSKSKYKTYFTQNFYR